VILVQPNDTVRFITRFTTFADDSVPYMFHCHLLHHEDEGMMGTFLVLDTTSTGVKDHFSDNKINAFPNPAFSTIQLQLSSNFSTTLEYKILNLLGETVMEGRSKVANGKTEIDIAGIANGIYIISVSDKNEQLSAFKIVKQ